MGCTLWSPLDQSRQVKPDLRTVATIANLRHGILERGDHHSPQRPTKGARGFETVETEANILGTLHRQLKPLKPRGNWKGSTMLAVDSLLQLAQWHSTLEHLPVGERQPRNLRPPLWRN